MTVRIRRTKEHGLQVLEAEPGVRRKRKWTVTGSYITPQGKQEFTASPKKKCYLADLRPAIEAAMCEDGIATGWVDDIEWTAIGR